MTGGGPVVVADPDLELKGGELFCLLALQLLAFSSFCYLPWSWLFTSEAEELNSMLLRTTPARRQYRT